MVRKWVLLASVLLLLSRGSRAAVQGQAGGFVYVANCGSPCDAAHPGSVSAYTIDGATGALTPVAGSPFPAGEGSLSVGVDPSGQFVYVGNSGSGDVSAYRIAATGALTPIDGSPFPAGTNPSSVAVDPAGQYVYV